MADEEDDDARRERMVREQIVARGVTDARVLAAMRRVPRHRFVPAALAGNAYADTPLAIGHGQTISQPYIVARMCELAALTPTSRVLEIGTGCGYQAAVLAQLTNQVYTIEIVEALAQRAEATLRELGLFHVHVRCGDGSCGWPEAAPFDAIVVAAAPEEVPQPLLDQLGADGRLVVPVGGAQQDLRLYQRTARGVTMEPVLAVTFVPMTGSAGGDRPR